MAKFIFRKKEIIDFTLGEILQEQRKREKINLEKAAKDVKIDIKYLQSLENGDYDKLPQGIYGKSFLREYCDYLGLNYKDLARIYDQENNLENISEKGDEVFSHKRAKKSYFLSLPKIIRNIILVLVVVAGFFYLGLKFKEIVAPPEIIIDFPPENYITKESKISIKGKVDGDARVFINDEEILSSKAGEFDKAIDLKNGINIIKIKASKRYGKDAEVVRQVLVK
ncbi:MAG: helix-turn-helix domain-containing protein [Patescibacteria group bacterium]